MYNQEEQNNQYMNGENQYAADHYQQSPEESQNGQQEYYQSQNEEYSQGVYAPPPVFGGNQIDENQTYQGQSQWSPEENYYQQEPDEQSYYYNQEEPADTSYQNYDSNTAGEDGEEYKEVPRKKNRQGEVVSTNQSINLTCTLAAFMGVFALFLYFADERSVAVRRVSVQSIALLIAEVAITLGLWVLGVIFSVIPILGTIMSIILWLAFIAMVVVAIFLKYQLMFNAYRGRAYVLPIVGEQIRRFE